MKNSIHFFQNAATNKEIRVLVEDKNWKELSNRLLTRLKFGTAGLRARMQAGFNGMNDLVVIQSAQGLLKEILSHDSSDAYRKRGIIIGYDGRFHSKRFAELTATIFINENIPVWLYSKTVATPFVPFGIRVKGCLAGVMVTASHNPKEDNGYKVYWSNGVQIQLHNEKAIEASILENLVPFETSWNTDVVYKSPLYQDPLEEMIQLYYERLSEQVPKNFVDTHNSKSDIKFIYSAMHGVGYPYVKYGFETANLQNLIPVIEQRDPDPEFPTVKFPNPEEGKSSLTLSIKLAEDENSTIILANDPDADRLACAEKDASGAWKVFTGNELGCLLGWWSLKCHQVLHPNSKISDCYMVASTVSSKILKSMGRIEGFNFAETLTGFKFMGNKSDSLLKEGKTVLFAFEEAIGFMISPVVLDKDGVSAAVHLATMINYIKDVESLTLSQKLSKLYEQYGYHSSITSYYFCYDPDLILKIFNRIRNRDGPDSGTYAKSVNNGIYAIDSVRDVTIGIDTSRPDGKSDLPIQKNTQMITFTFANGVVITLRTSGTEPKLKYYAEICAQPGNT